MSPQVLAGLWGRRPSILFPHCLRAPPALCPDWPREGGEDRRGRQAARQTPVTPPSLEQRNMEEAEKGGIPPSGQGTATDSMGEQGALMEAGMHPWAFTEGWGRRGHATPGARSELALCGARGAAGTGSEVVPSVGPHGCSPALPSPPFPFFPSLHHQVSPPRLG